MLVFYPNSSTHLRRDVALRRLEDVERLPNDQDHGCNEHLERGTVVNVMQLF